MKYTDTHEWISMDKNNIGIIGITDHAKQELGEIIFIELPKLEITVKAGEEICVLESAKAAADIYSPVSGKIIEVNEELVKDPTKIMDEGNWLFKIKMSNTKEYESLMDEETYFALIHPM